MWYITGTRRGLGKYLKDKYPTTTLEDCNLIINSKHETQQEILKKGIELNKKIITIGSYASDFPHISNYHRTKLNTRNLNAKYFTEGYDVTCINFSYFDTERVKGIDKPKMSLQEVENIME